MKRPNLRIIGIEEGEELQIQASENIFNKTREENFLNLKKDVSKHTKKHTEHQIDWTRKENLSAT